MSPRLTVIALLAAPVLGALAGCEAPAPRVTSAAAGAGGQADPAVVAQCRQQAEDVFNAQNRSSRIQVNTRDSPFSASPTPVAATRGLSDRFALDTMIGDCIRNSSSRQTGPDLGTAPPTGQASVQPGTTARPASRLPAGPTGGPPASSVSTAPAGVPLDRAPPPPAPVRP